MIRKMLEIAAKNVGPRDFDGFVEQLDSAGAPAALVELQRMHAESADSNTPPVRQWPAYAAAEWAAYVSAGNDPDDPDAAREWWEEVYGG